MAGGLTNLEREQVAAEARHWVRITRVCNNRCAFCLDSDAQDGSRIPSGEVEAEIDRGRRQGARRLILSGGEATIHPDFLDLIAHGKRVGYTHVQTITNGRMLAYPDLVRRAITAGLDEVTFSLHGHTAALHDALTGVPGSYDQTVAGIRNAVASRALIVSGDVVINRVNVPHLRDVMERFVELGVYEIDLLMVVPFGRATPGAKASMLFDAREALPHLRRALELADRQDLTIWTNRLDPRLLEGHESLIQDPHKLHDEVRGRADLFDAVLDGGPMRCAGERCPYCFIRPLCDALRDALRELGEGVPGVLAVDLRTGMPAGAHGPLLDQPRRALAIRANDPGQLSPLVGLTRAQELWLTLDDHHGLRRTLRTAGATAALRLVPPGPRALGDALGCQPPTLVVTVDPDTAPLLPDLDLPAATRLLLAVPAADTLEQASRRHLDLGAALAGVDAEGYLGIPPCLGGGDNVTYDDVLPLEAVTDAGRLDLHAFVDHFIGHRYRVRSLRCERCAFAGTCRGIGIQVARHAGLAQLLPREI